MLPKPRYDDVTVELEEEWTSTPWGRIFASTGGRTLPGTPVILVHGLVVSSRYMVPTAVRLARYLPVYAVDLPGYGKSSKPKLHFTISDLADALESWLSAKGMKRVHLVGNSMGCQVITELALRFPGRIDRIVLHGPSVDPGARALLPQLWKQVVNTVRQRSVAGVVAKDLWAMGVFRAAFLTREALRDTIEERLPLLHMPVLVVRGAKDPICPADWAEQAVRLLPQGELRVVPGGPHALNDSMPLEFVRVILPFLCRDDPFRPRPSS